MFGCSEAEACVSEPEVVPSAHNCWLRRNLTHMTKLWVLVGGSPVHLEYFNGIMISGNT